MATAQGPEMRPVSAVDSTPASKEQYERIRFEPTRHLAYEPPEQIIMMEEIGFPRDRGISPVAVSTPFQLFTEEAIHAMRLEISSEEVQSKYLVKSNLANAQLRGYAAECAPFTFEVWNHPATLKIISDIAGVELIPNMNVEIGHINFSFKTEQQMREELDSLAGSYVEDDKPIVGWHNDSYPFVCVTMLSDCTNMVGGETALRTGTGDVMRVRGPQMGCAVVLQGRYITHQALRTLGAQERITSVTSFRPKSPFLRDDSVLSNTRGITDPSELHYEYGTYRLQMLQERIQAQLKRMHDAHSDGKRTDEKALKAFLDEQYEFIGHMNGEIIPEEDIVKGHLPELDIPNAVSETLRSAKL